MTLRVVLMGLLVLLSSCSYLGLGSGQTKSDDGLERPTRPGTEEIAEVKTELPPRESEAPAPSQPRASSSSTSSSGVDPRKARDNVRAGVDPGSSGGPGSSGPVDTTDIGSTQRTRPSKYAYKPPDPANAPQAPMAGRVGIMNLLGNELRHVHAGTTPFGNHEQNYNVQYDFGGQVMEELRKALLTRTPYQPVPLASTGALRQAASTWQDTWDGKSFSPTLQREFDGIMEQNRLAMIIVVSYPTIDDGVVGTSQTLTGSGLYTRTFLGKTQAAVFSTLQFYRIVGKPARLIHPIAPEGERSVGDLPNANLPDDLDDLPARYLVPVYEPLRNIVNTKIRGLISLPRKLGQ